MSSEESTLKRVEEAMDVISRYGRRGIVGTDLFKHIGLDVNDEGEDFSLEERAEMRDTVWMSLSQRRDVTLLAAPMHDFIGSGGKSNIGMVRFVASQDRRLLALGVKDVMSVRSLLDNDAIDILERCAVAGEAGVESAVLAKMIGLDNNQFHFWLGRLIGAGLIVKRLGRRSRNSKFTNYLATSGNVVYLRRFVPAVDPEQSVYSQLESATVAVLNRYNIGKSGVAVIDIADVIAQEDPFCGILPWPKKRLAKLFFNTFNGPGDQKTGSLRKPRLEVFDAIALDPLEVAAKQHNSMSADGELKDRDIRKSTKTICCVRLAMQDDVPLVSDNMDAESNSMQRFTSDKKSSFNNTGVAKSPTSSSWIGTESSADFGTISQEQVVEQYLGDLGVYHSICAFAASRGTSGVSSEDLRANLGLDKKVLHSFLLVINIFM